MLHFDKCCMTFYCIHCIVFIYFIFFVIYRDFALRNCLVSSDLTVKVGDYGLAEEIFKVKF